MELQTQFLADKLLRNYRNLFTARQMNRLLSDAGVKLTLKETVDYLEANPLVFSLQDKLYITRAGAFTDELFSIKPTAAEWNQGVLVPGDRLVPFTDPEMLSCSMDFYCDGVLIPKKTGVFDSDAAIDFFILYGEEYAPQYIASDPASRELDLPSRDFELPNTVKLTGLDLNFMEQQFSLVRGDRLLCCVNDWNNGIISLMIVREHENQFNCGKSGEERLKWYKSIEGYFLKDFDRLGPCGSIEEQVADVFFEHRKELCLSSCGSMEEYLNHHARKVGMEYFGVETRLWRKGETVPAVGKWNDSVISEAKKMESLGKKALASLNYSVPSYILNLYLQDMNFRRSEDLKAVFDRIFPKECHIPEKQKEALLLHMQEQNAIVSQKYNWFQDQIPGPARSAALELYGKVAWLVYRIDCVGGALYEFPQQELVILSQLYSHLLKVLQAISDDDYTDADYESLSLSLEGMKWNFEDIEGQLEKAVKTQHTNKFKVVKS